MDPISDLRSALKRCRETAGMTPEQVRARRDALRVFAIAFPDDLKAAQNHLTAEMARIRTVAALPSANVTPMRRGS